MSFYFPVRLYFGCVRRGQITFHSFHVKQFSDYTCEPENLLVLDEAIELFHQMRRSPLSEEGKVGEYTWRFGSAC
jgi:hypothetical protein